MAIRNKVSALIKYALVFLLMGSNTAYAFKLDPFSKRTEVNGVPTYEKVYFPTAHENLTLAAIEQANIPLSIKENFATLDSIIAGIRWNDDPIQMATGKPFDFYIYYKDSCNNKDKIDPSWSLLYRTHCGDMQFLHAMASFEDETAEDTFKLMMMWSEFTFKISTGEIPHNLNFRSMHLKLNGGFLDKKYTGECKNVLDPQLVGSGNAAAFSYLMTNNGSTRMCWEPEDLFTRKCVRQFKFFNLFFRNRLTEQICEYPHNDHSQGDIRNRALGSLLHLIQDSFSDSHAKRLPKNDDQCSRLAGIGKIEQFGTFKLQSENQHSKADMLSATCGGFMKNNTRDNNGLNLIEVSAQIIEKSFEFRDNTESGWQSVRPILANALAIANQSNHVTPGHIGYPLENIDPIENRRR